MGSRRTLTPSYRVVICHTPAAHWGLSEVSVVSQYTDYEDEDDAVDIGRPGNLARVRHISGDGCQISVELRSGQFGTATSDGPFDLDVGDVVILNEGVHRVPEELWIEESWVGVIKVKLEDVTIVDGGGRWRLVPTRSDVDYSVGNTVEATDARGVLRVLHRDPIRLVEFGELDESIVEGFKPPLQDRQETFDDFGGLPDVVARARELIEVPLAHHDRLAKINARPIKGVLFTGPPGAGKTMLARIIANKSGAEFLEISGPQFISKWVGQSEEILRLIFDHARKQKRCIVFFDEIDTSPANAPTTRTSRQEGSSRSS